ncbi:TPA: aldehyde dehydrogenase [Burkholderia aenigmatica]|uniref:thiamine pyrophosphate-dependent enzyme n=1 Tax=Burkholderia sp. AU45251 TaxID=3059204 RepID=UPI00264AC917|nr:thiamine pyrophosphate-dependent enzyme [Burkholderia sp. AU45251]HDR9482493.1 aldehyde dehydrogenase [Burkholderia aenigmatica]MDN7514867.1 thiamine pyrophosphate-dependent enzyme [Burkholderia sp. AU45251]HDR9514799.1 aldehyde dehydrogenase [Burkholderia aenigmatica]HDR9590864.1 aldehyde dehydrogenase [Burkholderia aenigmatica]HDR9602796.1 aldehyde dehydrogenase [Burkholderia aenigmatica]
MSGQNTKTIERRAFVASLLAGVPDALVVTGLGSASYDVFAAGDRVGNFYLWGAMGGAAALGLGLALAQPERQVVVVTGDGEQLMGIGVLGTIGAKQPKNLTIVVLDNGHYGETGMQQSHSSLGTDLVAVAKGFGLADSFAIRDERDVTHIVERVKVGSGPVFAQVHIRADEPPRALPPRDGVYIKNRFREGLGFAPF